MRRCPNCHGTGCPTCGYRGKVNDALPDECCSIIALCLVTILAIYVALTVMSLMRVYIDLPIE